MFCCLQEERSFTSVSPAPCLPRRCLWNAVLGQPPVCASGKMCCHCPMRRLLLPLYRRLAFTYCARPSNTVIFHWPECGSCHVTTTASFWNHICLFPLLVGFLPFHVNLLKFYGGSSIQVTMVTCFDWRLIRMCSDVWSSKHDLIPAQDLAARNIMIDRHMVSKIGDFGMARDISADQVYVSGKERVFPIKWTAPEVCWYFHWNVSQWCQTAKCETSERSSYQELPWSFQFYSVWHQGTFF